MTTNNNAYIPNRHRFSTSPIFDYSYFGVRCRYRFPFKNSHYGNNIDGTRITLERLPWKGRIRKVTKFEGESSGFWGKGDLGAIGPFSNSKNNLRCAWSCDVSMTLKKKNPTENRKNKKKKNVIRISMNYRWPQKK